MQAVVGDGVTAIDKALCTAARKHNRIFSDKSDLAVFHKIIFAADIDSAIRRIFNRAVHDFAVFACNVKGIGSCALQGKTINGNIGRFFCDTDYIFIAC